MADGRHFTHTLFLPILDANSHVKHNDNAYIFSHIIFKHVHHILLYKYILRCFRQYWDSNSYNHNLWSIGQRWIFWPNFLIFFPAQKSQNPKFSLFSRRFSRTNFRRNVQLPLKSVKSRVARKF